MSLFGIRDADVRDWVSISELTRASFGGSEEARLVRRLRPHGAVLFELVFTSMQRGIVGHIMMSRGSVAGRDLAILAPLCVREAFRRRGIGSALVRAALERVEMPVLVVGDPAFYSRFGFRDDLARKLHSPWSGPASMAYEHRPGVLQRVEGEVRYPAAFYQLA